MSVSSHSFAVEIGLVHLFGTIENRFKSTKLGSESWYILTVACLAASPDPELAAQLYVYLRENGSHPTSEDRQRLMRRLREALVKSVAFIGVCKPIEAVISINEVENKEDKDYSTTRREWQIDETNQKKASEWFKKIYSDDSKGEGGVFDAHLDFAWISTQITYGLYMSDRQVLNDVDTEMVVLPAVMMQNLKKETHWHIRGTRWTGVSKEDTQVIWECVHLVAEHFGIKLTKLPTVEQVEPDVNAA